jgi:hypothetical protein
MRVITTVSPTPGALVGARRRGVLLLLVVLQAVACEQPTLPTAPSDLLAGLVIYEHANFLGRDAHITADISDLKEFDGPCKHESTSGSPPTTTTSYDWNDCVSSARVAPGWVATLYRDDDFKGQSFEVTSDASNLQVVPGSCDHDGLNDCVTSIRIARR